MPVVINRSDPGGSGSKGDKSKASSAKSPAKPAAAKTGKASGGGSSAFAQMDEKKKIIGLSVVIVLSLVFVLWMTGMLPIGGHSAAPPPDTSPTYNPETASKNPDGQPAAPVTRPNAFDRKTRINDGVGTLPQGAPGGLGAQPGTELGDGKAAGNGIN